MMLRYMGWTEAADLLIQAIDKTISEKPSLSTLRK